TVIGAGVMGSGIAQTFAVAGLDTVCVDVDDAALERARQRILDGRYGLTRARDRGHLQQLGAAPVPVGPGRSSVRPCGSTTWSSRTPGGR
ncbi:MAG: 3-hydroxyacyl-CoA dehydrogenase NAD-binding domain-containing protein, partial [Actinomycetota bacterium]|nr:3-hydroxyacyl-CoA dehydrogenase NAD-binding domain-containing protein [Actinomycetota bacterium]